MRSSAGSRNPERRAPVWLAGVAGLALALALGLSYVATVPRPEEGAVASGEAPVVGRFVAPVAAAPQPVDVPEDPLWARLHQWTVDVDSLAVLGLSIVLVVRNVRRRGKLR